MSNTKRWVLLLAVGLGACSSRTMKPHDGDIREDGSRQLDRDVGPTSVDGKRLGDLPVSDLPPIPDGPTPDTMAGNNHCAGAAQIGWSGGKARAKGDLTTASNTVDIKGCDWNSIKPQPDLFYRLSVVPGKTYRLAFESHQPPMIPSGPPKPTWFPIAFVFESCATPTGTILGCTNATLETTFTAKSKTVLIGVEGAGIVHGPSCKFSLYVEEYQPPNNDTCPAATPLGLSGGTAKVAVSLSEAANDNQMGHSKTCTVSTSLGPDVFYKVNVVKQKAYRIVTAFSPALHVSPYPWWPSWPVAVYLFESCADPEKSCLGGYPSEASITKGPSYPFIPKQSGVVHLGIDTDWPSHMMLDPVTLTIEEYTLPANNTCAGATPLVLAGTPNKATAAGDTSMATDNLDLKGVFVSTPGPDLFFSLGTVAGQSYMLTLKPGASCIHRTTVFESCADPAGTKLSGGAPFTADKATTVYIAVDSSPTGFYTPAMPGPFTLTVEEFTAPANNICAGAQLLALAGTPKKAAAQGDTSTATSTVNITANKTCPSIGNAGPELFYALSTVAGKSYTVEANPVPQPGAVVPPGVLVFDSCADPSASCIASSMGNAPGSSTLSFVASSTGTLYIAVAWASNDKPGPFTLTVEESP